MLQYIDIYKQNKFYYHKMDRKKELTNKIKLYHFYNTYINIVEEGNYGERYWNGFVDEVKGDNILLFDVIKQTIIPVMIDNIKEIDVSTKTNPNNSQATNMYDEFKLNRGKNDTK